MNRDPESRISSGQGANPFLNALKNRKRLALNVFLGVLFLAVVAAFFVRQYTALAAVALNPNVDLNSDGETGSAVEVAWSTLTDKQIATVISRYQLDTGIVQLLRQDQSFTYLRSKISLHEIALPGNRSPEIAVSFTGQTRASAIEAANALAGILGQAKAPASAAPSSPSASVAPPPDALEKARSELKMLAESQNIQVPQQEVQARLIADAKLQAARRVDMVKLAALEQESEQLALAASKPSAPAPRPPDPARTALLARIREVQAHLAQLRQRYTEEYPDVMDAEATLAGLQAKLSLMPPDTPPPPAPARRVGPTPEQVSISNEEDQLRADQSRLDQAIQKNQNQAEALRERIADAKSFAQDYAFEQQRYQSLLRQTQAAANTSGSPSAPTATNAGLSPLFIVVKSATTAEASGVVAKPSFWLLCLLAALIAASLTALLAELSSPSLREEAPSGSLRASHR